MYANNTPETVKAFLGDCHNTIFYIICSRDSIQSFFIYVARKKNKATDYLFRVYESELFYFLQFLFKVQVSLTATFFFYKQNGVAKRACITCRDPWIIVPILHCRASAFLFLKGKDYFYVMLKILSSFNIPWLFDKFSHSFLDGFEALSWQLLDYIAFINPESPLLNSASFYSAQLMMFFKGRR